MKKLRARWYFEFLRKALPLKKYDVHLFLMKWKGDAGICYGPYKRRGRKPIIRIYVNQAFSLLNQFDTIIHEYAHAICIERGQERKEEEFHDENWGKAYADVYRASLDYRRPTLAKVKKTTKKNK